MRSGGVRGRGRPRAVSVTRARARERARLGARARGQRRVRPALNAVGGRAWAIGGRVMRDGTAVRKKRKGFDRREKKWNDDWNRTAEKKSRRENRV